MPQSLENIECFHGTHSDNVEAIIEKGFVATIRKDHWLGQGIYFYDNLERAKWWIRTKNKRKNVYSKEAVIQVWLDYESHNSLDLDNPIELKKAIYQWESILKEIGAKKFHKKEQYKNLCYLLDLYKQKYSIDIIKGTFLTERTSFVQDSRILADFEDTYFELPLGLQYKETQICIRNNAAINEKVCVYNNGTLNKYKDSGWK